MERYERWQKKQLYHLGDTIERNLNEIKRAISRVFLAVMAIISIVVPMPQSLKEMLYRRYFFSPHKVSSSLLLKSPELRQKIVKLGFHPDKDSPLELSAWFIKAEKDKPTVVFSHGRDCNISHLEHIIKAFTKKGYGIFVYDYPGFGRSDGKPDEQLLYDAGLAASKFLSNKDGILNIPFEQQIIVGHSLGGAVAVDVAKKLSDEGIHPKALVLISTFKNLKSWVDDEQKKYWRPIRNAVRIEKVPYDFNSSAKIPYIKMPMLVFHAERDKVISPSHGKQLRHLFKRLQEKADPESRFKHDFVPLNSGHRLTDQSCETIVDNVDKFLQDLNPKPIKHLA